MKNSERLVNAINDYVSLHGTDTVMDMRQILSTAGLLNSIGNIFPSDYCYNRYNFALKDFSGPFLFEYLGVNKYLVLGQNYPFSGDIYHKPKGGNRVIVVGKWENGKKTLYQDVLSALR